MSALRTEITGPAFAGEELLVIQSISPPLRSDSLCLTPWHSSRKPLETNPNYPCCRTWRIQAHSAAGAAHFSSFCLQHPHPPAPQKRTGGHATHPAGPSTFKAPPGGAPLARPGLTHVLQVGGSGRLSSQELKLQLLPLAPQPATT